jgi:plasmid stability protein
MGTTLTIRTDRRLRTALETRARAQGKTVSALAREILETALAPQPLGQRTGHLRGALRGRAAKPDAWRAALRDRNWRR